MKLRHLFLAAIVALGMMACNNEDVPQPVDGAESTVSIKVMPSSNSAGARATGQVTTTTAGSTAESKITQLEVYLFYGDVLQVYKDSTNTTGVNEVTSIATTTGPKSVIVIANGGIGSVSSKATLLEKTKEIPVTGDLPMTGMTATDIIVEPGYNQYGYKTSDTNYKSYANSISENTPLPLTRVNARVAIVNAKVDESLATDDDAILDALTDVDVAMFNVPKASKIFGAAGSLAKNESYLFGEAWPSPATSYAAGTAETYFKDASVLFPISNTASAPSPYYYVTENTATDKVQQMLIVLRGKPTKKGNPVKAEGLYTDGNGYTYYPIWVNNPNYSYDASHTADSRILRNTQYNITLLIKGIGNPTIDPVQDAWLDVMVQVEPWAVVNQDVTWN